MKHSTDRHTVAGLLLATLLLAPVLETRADPPPAEAAYQKARRAFYRFKANPGQQKFRHHWLRVAGKFEYVAREYPRSSRAPDALFTAAKLYLDLYHISRVPADIEKSLELFGKLVELFPANHLADDAQLYVATAWLEYLKQPERARRELAFLVRAFPDGDVTPQARRMLEDLGGGLDESQESSKKSQHSSKSSGQPASRSTPAAALDTPAEEGSQPLLETIKHWSNRDYTRIALYTRTPAKFRVGRLPAKPGKGKPHRLYIDLLEAELGDEVPTVLKVDDSLVNRIRVAEHDKGFIRVVLDCSGPFIQRVFPLQNPQRVVIDLSREARQAAKGEKDHGEQSAPRPTHQGRKPKRAWAAIRKRSRPEVSLSAMAGLKIKRVVVDPGHGGRDPGAIGAMGTLEKNLTLDIARRLGRLLRERLKLEVLLTRNRDEFLSLEERTAFANEKRADLFVSIHLNAHRNRHFYGVETFYLDLTDDRYSIRLAARENATSEKSIADLKYILADLATKSNTDDSILLSRLVQKAITTRLRSRYRRVKSLGTKPALFYVLIGARMPAILVEASFITNRREEKRLRQAAYRQLVAEGICAGIGQFIKAREKLYAGGE